MIAMEETDFQVGSGLYHPLGGRCGTSETSFALNLLVFLLSSGVCFASYLWGVTSYVSLCFILMASLLVFSVSLEAFIYPKTSWIAFLDVKRSFSWRRFLYREVALIVTFGVIGLGYWLFPVFSDSVMKKCYHPFLAIVVPILLVASVPYFWLMDRCDAEEEDVLCRLGRAIVTRRRTLTRFEFANYVRSWAVKAFWLSIMQPQVIEKLRIFLCYRWEKLAGNPLETVLMASVICFSIDLAYAASGYALNFKMFSTQTRTAEPTLLGWLVAIICYWPFWNLFLYPRFFKYDAPTKWSDVFATGGFVWWTWAMVIIGLELLYALSTVSAGIRFSNLTYRGLWNTGPYRWTKHPAYVFKCVSWWLIYLPFVVNTGAEALRCSLLLVLVNVIYFLRARTEERHLSHYPEYVQYAQSMDSRSIFRWVGRLFPGLRYHNPKKSS